MTSPTKIPASFEQANEQAMAVEVAEMLKTVEGMLTFDRDWFLERLRGWLWQGLQQEPIDSGYLARVIDAANEGDDIADEALRLVDADFREIGVERKTLAVYCINAVKRDHVKRGSAQKRLENFRRDYAIPVLVFMILLRFPGLRPTRNALQRRPGSPSACSILVAAMQLRGLHPPGETTVQNIYTKNQGHMGIYLRDN